MDIAVQTTSFGFEDRTWLASRHGTDAARTVTLDMSAFVQGTHYPNGYLPSGIVLGRITATGCYGPYSGTSSAVQSVTISGAPTGGTFTLTYGGHTTTAIAYNASAAAVQAALQALASIGAGNCAVTGAAGGPWTVTFTGALADQAITTMTESGASLTGGTSPAVAVASVTTGGADESADGRQVAAGILWNTTDVSSGQPKYGSAMLEHCFVLAAHLPAQSGLDPNAMTDFAGRVIFR
jgi:hypothetical protein